MGIANNVKAPGKIFLQITGVLLIVFGAFGVLFGATTWLAANLIISGTGILSNLLSGLIPQAVTDIMDLTPFDPAGMIAGTVDDVFAIVVSRMRAIGVLRILEGGFLIFLGIMGAVFCRDLAKSKRLIVFAAIGIVLVSIQLFVGLSIISVLRLALLVFFMIGAIINAKTSNGAIKTERIEDAQCHL